MKNYFKLFVVILALAVLPFMAQGQSTTATALTATTLSAAINNSQSCFGLASVSGISTSANNAVGGTSNTAGSFSAIYMDRELGYVQSVNTSAKTVCVLRGMGGTLASSHASGVMVLVGPPNSFVDYDPAGFCGTSTPPNF